MKVSGKVKHILATKSGNGAKGAWSSTDVVVEMTDEKGYTSSIVLTLYNKQEELAKLIEGAEATFNFNCRASEYNGKWYNQLQVWSVWLDNAPQNSTPQAQATQSAPTQSSGGYEPAF